MRGCSLNCNTAAAGYTVSFQYSQISNDASGGGARFANLHAPVIIMGTLALPHAGTEKIDGAGRRSGGAISPPLAIHLGHHEAGPLSSEEIRSGVR